MQVYLIYFVQIATENVRVNSIALVIRGTAGVIAFMKQAEINYRNKPVGHDKFC